MREHEDKPSDQSSAEKMLLGATPGVIRALAEVSLVEAAATRAARSVSRAQAAKIDDVALGQPYRLVEEIKRTPRVRDRSRQPKAYVVPWSIMVAGLDAPVDRPAAGVDQRIVERWRVDAAHLGAAAILGLDPHEGDTFATAVPQGRDAELLVDGRLKLPRRLRRPEQTALLAVTAWLRRDASHIRLKHLPDARAFVGILAAMGFSEDEVRLSVTNYAGERLSSGELHVFLRGSVPGHPLATRRGWTGSLVVRLQPTEIAGPRRGWQAARFALVMLAVDAGVYR